MKRFQMAFALCGVLALVPGTLSACPLCAEAIASSEAAEEEKSNFPAAMNQSIYLMVSVPYLLLGGVGFIIYRGVKKNAEHLRALDQKKSQIPNK